jgi:hypothetical protein
MKKAFSAILTCMLLASCVQGNIDLAQDLVQEFNNTMVSDQKKAASFWCDAVYKAEEIEAIVKAQANVLGDGIQSAKFEVLESKSYKTWVFAGVIYKEAVEVDVLIRIPPTPPKEGDILTPSPKSYRQLTYVVDVDGQQKIIQSQIREVK